MALAQPAVAQDTTAGTNDFGGFRNVLPGGQGETVNAAELAAFQATREPPSTFTSQLPLYTELLYASPALTAADLDKYFKPASFGVPEAERSGQTDTPRPGVTIIRDRAHGVPHVYGATRSDTMFGAGYASAQDRLFLMDVLRHTGRGRLTELIGPGTGDSNVRMDAAQLKIADYSETELTRMIDEAVAANGSEGALVKQDLLDYVAGINAYIAEARNDPDKLPAEYAALAKPLEDWKPEDTVAVASLIGGIFGRGGGAEADASQALRAAQQRFGVRRGRAVFDDLRSEDDPEAPVTTGRRFPYDNPGEFSRRAVAIPDLGSIKERNPVVAGSPLASSPDGAGAATGGAHGAPGPAWLADLGRRGLVFPREQSNALLVTAAESKSGRPLAVMGPQVGYFSPQILMELDVHGPGIDARGAAFPGISLYVLLGRGQDFAWSATTATTDVVDEFVEKLCEPDGSTPTLESTHYVYKGRCRPFHARDHVLEYAPAPTDAAPGGQEPQPRRITLRVERSVHGPIQARATVNGDPVAIAERRSTYFHELDSAIAFKRLNGNEVTDAASFRRTMAKVNFAFNWFYADDRDIAYIQSGWYPRRARGTDSSLPAWGTGEWEWRGSDEEHRGFQIVPFERLPQAVNPRRGYLVNWNNKQAPGWRAADDQWGFGSIHRSERLEDPLRAALRGRGKIDLVRLVQIMEEGATIDIRGQEVYPWIRRVIGPTSDRQLRSLLERLDAWSRSGAHRRDLDRDGFVEHSAAVALIDAWWPSMLRRVFEPTMGVGLVDRVREMVQFGSPPPRGGSAFGSGWWGFLDKDLRSLLRKRVRGPLSLRFCGRGSRTRCRAILRATLKDAAARVAAQQGTDDMSKWRVRDPCKPGEEPPLPCDQISFTTAGAIPTDPIHWQDRPTFQQVVEVLGHRAR